MCGVFIVCAVGSILSAEDNAGSAKIDLSALKLGFATQEGDFVDTIATSRSVPQIKLDKIPSEKVSISAGICTIELSGRVEDPHAGIVKNSVLTEIRAIRRGKIRGTIALKVVDDKPTPWSPHAKHFTFLGSIKFPADEKINILRLETVPNEMGVNAVATINVETADGKSMQLEVHDEPPAESSWQPYTLIVRAPSDIDEKAINSVRWFHCGRSVTLMKRLIAPNLTAEKTVDFIPKSDDGGPLIMVMPPDVNLPVLGARPNKMAFGAAIYLGTLEGPGGKEPVRVGFDNADNAFKKDLPPKLHIAAAFDDLGGKTVDCAEISEGSPRPDLGMSDPTKPGVYKGEVIISEHQRLGANFGAIVKEK